MKASELLALLQKAIKVHGDTDVNVHVYDYQDKYNMREHHVPVENARAVSTLGINEDTAKIVLVVRVRE